MWHWIVQHLGAVVGLFRRLLGTSESKTGGTVSAGRDAATATGSNISQTVNSPTFKSSTINLTLPVQSSDAAARRYAEWRELIDELRKSFVQMGYAFLPVNVITPGDERNDYEAGIQRGFRVIRSRLLIAEPLKHAGILEKYRVLVQYAVSSRNPRDPNQRGCATMTGFDIKAAALEDELLEIARKDVNAPADSSARFTTG